MNYLKLFGGLFAALALAAAAWLVKDRFHQKALSDAAASCAHAAADPADEAALSSCLPEITNEVKEARQNRVCDRALLPSLLPENRFAMQQACGSGVKRLVAASDAAAADRDSLKSQLDDARAGMAAAVARAEARAAHQTQRNDNGRKVIQSAPRDAAGNVRCDAECLRRLGT